MKKRLALLITPLLALVLTGCFGDSDVPDPTADLPYETFQGTLQSLGNVNFSAKATHLLRQTDGGILYVYSDFYDLNGVDILNHKLEVSGLLFPPDDQSSRETLAIDALKILEDEMTESGEVVREAYTNETLGFTWIFRNDWVIEENSLRVIFTAPLPEMTDEEPLTGPVLRDVIEVWSMPNTQELPIEEWYLTYVLPSGVVSPYTLSAIGPEVLPAIRADIKDVQGNTVLYYIADEAQVIIISHHSLQADHRLEYSNLFADMLFSFDALSDGLRELVVVAPEAMDEPTVGVDPVDDTTIDPLPAPSSNYQVVIDSLEKVKLSTLIPQSGFWSATRYDFADPNYLYVVYENTSGVEGRVLLRYSGSNFERLASFESGAFTDWELKSGVDEAKNKSFASIKASGGVAVVIPEGYRSMESASLHFQMHYPGSWFYSRSGSFFYFSNAPADAGNALVSIELLSSPTANYREESAGSAKVILVPRDESSSFRLQSSAEYFDDLKVMAKSISSTNP